MSTENDANVLHSWLVREGLFGSSVMAPTEISAEDLALLEPITDAGKDVLRSKGVQLLLINEVDSKITVFLKRARPSKKQLALLPQTAGESSITYLQGVAKEIGATPPTAHGKPFYVVQRAGSDHYACGSSISLGNCRDAGSLGTLVKDADDVLYGMSNNHVTGGCNYAQKQMPVVAPGVFDVSPLGFDPITLGYHEKSIPLVAGIPGTADIENNLDAAIFKIRDEATVSSMQGTWYDTPIATLPMTANMVVEKVGRTTGHTAGVITSKAHEPLGIQYAAQGIDYAFSGQVYFDPVFVIQGAGQAFSEEGDSGSLITTLVNGVRYAVGLLIGGAKGQGVDYTFAVPIEPILAKLGVTLVGGHNT